MAILVGRLLVKSMDFIVLLALARLLSQAAFGLIGLAMTFVVILEAILDVGLNQVLLKESKISTRMMDTVFTLGVLRGGILAIALCALSIPISLLYGEPRLAALTCVLALAPAFRGARSPAMIFYLRDMDFRWEVGLELFGKLIGGLICILCAATGGGYWALAIGVVLPPVLMNLGSYVVAPYRPRFSMMEWNRFSSFAGWMTVLQFSRAISWQFDKLLLGTFLAPAMFGRYSVAKDLSNTSQQAITPPMLKPLASAFSAKFHDTGKLGTLFVKACTAIFLIASPVFLTLALLSEHVVAVALGDQWSDTGWILRWFSVCAIFATLHRPTESLALVTDQTKPLAIGRVMTIAIRVPLILVGLLLYSWQGAVFALVISEVVTCSVMLQLGCILAKVSLSDLLMALRYRAIALLAMGGLLFWLTPEYVPGATSQSVILQCVFAACISTGAYIAMALVIWRLEGSRSGLESSVLEKLSGVRRLVLREA
jgi:O-antigen/teichoic acid export membrane protein